MTYPHDPAAPYPIVPKPPETKRRRRWPWTLAALLTLLFLIGKLAPSAETDTPTAQLADNAPITSTVVATTTTAPSTTTEAAAAALLAAPAPALIIDTPDAATAALTQLASLEVKGRAPKTGYDRELFGQSWSDDVAVDGGHNGCDTRNDVLRRDLTAIAATERSGGCVVTTGILADPYTSTTITFTRGADTSTAVQIDHVVALSDAWQKGAQQLDPDTLRNFANDPRNLQAVDGPTNSAKGDGDAATWLPPNNDYRCTYVARQVEVKADYRLWVTDAERDAITRVLTSCGGTAAPLETTVAATEPAPMVEEAPVIEQAFIPAPEPVQVYTPEPVAPAPAPQAAPDNSSSAGGGGGGSCGADSYINSAGNCVHSPVSAPSAPAGATAQCSDGTYSYSQSRRGTCSHHGGVDTWL